MSYLNAKLTGEDIHALETEIKYNIASARVDGAKLVRFDLCIKDENNIKRITGCVLRVLRSLKKQGAIQHFCDRGGLESPTPAAQFIINKYSDFVIANDAGTFPYYVII